MGLLLLADALKHVLVEVSAKLLHDLNLRLELLHFVLNKLSLFWDVGLDRFDAQPLLLPISSLLILNLNILFLLYLKRVFDLFDIILNPFQVVITPLLSTIVISKDIQLIISLLQLLFLTLQLPFHCIIKLLLAVIILCFFKGLSEFLDSGLFSVLLLLLLGELILLIFKLTLLRFYLLLQTPQLIDQIKCFLMVLSRSLQFFLELDLLLLELGVELSALFIGDGVVLDLDFFNFDDLHFFDRFEAL